jgi:hypothetical protein
MKVKELIEQLNKMDPDAVCIHSSDEEGNNYIQGLSIDERLMSEMDAKSYYLDQSPAREDEFTGYSGERDEDYEDFTIPCVVFYP